MTRYAILTIFFALLLAAPAQAVTRHVTVKPGKAAVWKTLHSYYDDTDWGVKIGRSESVIAEYGNRQGTVMWVYRRGVAIKVLARNGKPWRFRITNLSGSRKRVVIDMGERLGSG